MQAKYSLENHKVLVTGGASGIGLATVKAFLRNGATVAINDLPGKKLTETVGALRAEGFNVISAAGDVGDPNSVDILMGDAIAAMGGIDSLINNAGTPATTSPIPPSDFDQQGEGFWNQLLNVNLLGPYRCTKAAASALRHTKGSIVNTASVSAFGGGGSSSAYCATKAALVALTREWSRALAPAVRVNAIAPGLVESGWMCRFETTDFDVADNIPLARSGLPEEYAECILFLALSASYMTGQTMIVDGGLLA